MEAPKPGGDSLTSNCFCGQRNSTRTLGKGIFLCPVCHHPNRYKTKKRGCHWVLFPKCEYGEDGRSFVQCKRCGIGFPDEVLVTQKAEALETVILSCMIRYLIGIGTRIKMDSFELTCIRKAYEALVGEPITKERILKEKNDFDASLNANRAKLVPISIKKYLVRFSPIFDSRDKELILRGLIIVSFMAFGVHEMGSVEKSLLADAGRSLGMTYARTREVLEEEARQDKLKERQAGCVAERAIAVAGMIPEATLADERSVIGAAAVKTGDLEIEV